MIKTLQNSSLNLSFKIEELIVKIVYFSSVLFNTLLVMLHIFFYGRYLWNCLNQLTHAFRQRRNLQNNVKIGLNAVKAAIAQLRKMPFSPLLSDTKEVSECSICLEKFKDGDDVV